MDSIKPLILQSAYFPKVSAHLSDSPNSVRLGIKKSKKSLGLERIALKVEMDWCFFWMRYSIPNVQWCKACKLIFVGFNFLCKTLIIYIYLKDWWHF